VHRFLTILLVGRICPSSQARGTSNLNRGKAHTSIKFEVFAVDPL